MSVSVWKPELLAPAKNLERLKVAVRYGADAVYLGGQRYGLRARADNFTDAELAQAVDFAHQHGVKVYVTLNAFLHDEDFAGFEAFCGFLSSIGTDAVIVSDIGVVRRIQKCSDLEIHLSTQASCLNSFGARVWKDLGVERLVVGRELSVEEAGQIQRDAGIEVEMFVHGAMCMAYSGHCTISNFTAGRDSNRGGCSQSCRFPYKLESASASQVSSAQEMRSREGLPVASFMSSKDLLGIEQIKAFFTHRICSLKIEGRMKSSFYVATTCKTYRRLIDAYAAGEWSEALLAEARAELESIPHRDYASGSLDVPAGEESVYDQAGEGRDGAYGYVGVVVDTTPEKVVVRLSSPLAVGDTIEWVPFSRAAIPWRVEQIYSVLGESRESMRQDSVVCLPRTPELSDVERLNIVRMPHRSLQVAS
ncbi:MAG: U32 family peptidase [Myxococcales bacterium]|nr:U32 family peptidase [Myxococcales bacterium]